MCSQAIFDHSRANGGSHAAQMRPSEPWMKSAFLKAGHLPTLIACFLYFDLSFMVWVLLGPMAVLIAKDLNLRAGQKGLMVAVPVLAGRPAAPLHRRAVGPPQPPPHR